MFHVVDYEYFFYVLDNKLNQIINLDYNITLFGKQIFLDFSTTAHDFGWLTMIDHVGIIGVLVYFLFLLNYFRSKIKFLPPLILLLIASFHYPAIFQPTGQIITGILLTIRPKTNLDYFKYTSKKENIL